MIKLVQYPDARGEGGQKEEVGSRLLTWHRISFNKLKLELRMTDVQ